MKAKTELLLYRMGWVLDHMMHPSFRTMDQSFESWAYHGGCLRQIQSLENQCLVESKPDDGRSGKRVYRLTELGRLAALSGRDPEREWARSWDGIWRMVLFDVPESERRVRGSMRQVLIRLRFGCLQRSAWISPHPMTEIANELRKIKADAASLVLMEGHCCAGESPQEMTRKAWNFENINHAWQRLATHLDNAPTASDKLFPTQLAEWSETEFSYWKECAAIDPFLPAELLPDDYPGRSIWQHRCRILASLGTALSHPSQSFERSSK